LEAIKTASTRASRLMRLKIKAKLMSCCERKTKGNDEEKKIRTERFAVQREKFKKILAKFSTRSLAVNNFVFV
jgi:hypothetical protein